MSQCIQRHAAILAEMDFQALTKGIKKKKNFKRDFYMQQIWQHNPTMNYVNIKPDELN